MMEPIELRTHTGLWRIEKRLYKLYDFTLPMPVSVKQLGIFAVVGIPWLILMNLIGVPFAPPFGHLIWVAPPALVTWWANKPIAEGKRLGEIISSQVKYVFQARKFARMRPFQMDRVHRVHASVWRPHGLPNLNAPDPELQGLSFAKVSDIPPN
jgi:hypothetical protein